LPFDHLATAAGFARRGHRRSRRDRTPGNHHDREAAGFSGVLKAAGIEPAQDFYRTCLPSGKGFALDPSLAHGAFGWQASSCDG
jgi:hypothetical protein